MSKVIRVNTQTGAVTSENFKEEYKLFGNRGLIAKVMTDEVDPKCDPMGKDNKFLLTTGIFSGTNLTTAHRLSAGGKSPLTGTIKEANVGGSAGYALAGHGIKMVIIEDQPKDENWKLLVIDKEGNAELVPAEGYVGLNNYALTEKLQKKYGKKVSVVSIGTAGERGYRNCSVQVTDVSTGTPSRAAARGGMGAVMGSKKVKAIVISEPAKRASFEYVDKDKWEETRKALVEGLTARPGATTTVGTISVMDMVAPMALPPVKNFRGEIIPFKELNKINGAAFMKKLEKNEGKNQLPCQPGCVVRCSNCYNNSKGKPVTAGLEYETVALCGSNLEIYDLDTIAKMDHICDDLGVDTMETGATLGICMEAGKIGWGDKKGALALLKEMVDGTEFGQLLGQGTAAVAKELGVTRVPTGKGQAMSGYDPRNTQIVGITYATSPMGADHTAGVMMMPDSDMMPKQFRLMMGANMQNNMATCDNIMCMYGFMGTMFNPAIMPNLFAGAFGGEWDAAKITQIGKDTLKMEHAFNDAAGFTIKNNVLPSFFYDEPSPATGAVFNLTPEEMTEGVS